MAAVDPNMTAALEERLTQVEAEVARLRQIVESELQNGSATGPLRVRR